MRIRWTWHSAIALTIAGTATAQTPPAPVSATSATASNAPPRRDAASAPRGPSPYNATVSKGHAAMAARNIPAAIDAYRAAIAADPQNALPLYFLGEAQIAQGELAQADASFTSALALAEANDDLHARLLFVLADLRERQGNWVDARRAWETYGQFLSAHPNVKGYAETATQRSNVLAGHLDLETKSAAVKQRTEQRAKAPPPAPEAAPPPAKKK